jgi:hypothetical protein
MAEGLHIECMALIDKLGSEETIAALQPYSRMSAQAFILNMEELLGIKGTEYERITDITRLWEIISGNPEDVMEIEDGPERIIRTGYTNCPYRSGPKELCIWAHELMNQGICESISSEYECEFTQMISKGDPICCYTIAKKQ